MKTRLLYLVVIKETRTKDEQLSKQFLKMCKMFNSFWKLMIFM